MKHTYFHLCPYCGAALDPGERCDCRDPPKESSICWPEREHTPIIKERTTNHEENGRTAHPYRE